MTSDFNLFYTWLNSKKGLKEKSSRDVISRLKRASRLIDLDSNLPDDELLLKLGKSKEFESLSPFVKSQLKRAIILKRQFDREHKQ